MRNSKIIILGIICILLLSACGETIEAPQQAEGILTDRDKIQEVIKGMSAADNTNIDSKDQFEKPERANIDINNNPIRGDLKAPVTIIEFSDFECPICEQYDRETGKKIKEKYIDTGKVKMVYMDFPLYNIHEYALGAAKAGECAYQQGRFWEMHDYLFDNQYSWQNANIKATLTTAANQLGLNQEQFSTCYDADSTLEKIGADFYIGKSLGINGTPTFFINGKMIVGFKKFDEMSALIDSELK